MENVKYAAPSAQAQGSFTTPDNAGESKTRLKTELIPMGLQMCNIYGVVAIGTHLEGYQGAQPTPKTKILIALEFPQHKREFYEGEGFKSASLFQEMVFAAYTDKSKLRKIIEAACQRKVSDDEARDFDCTKLLGCNIMVNVTHYQKKDGNMGEKIESFASIVGMPTPIGYAPENDKWLFYLDKDLNNFRTEMFARLPFFLKKKLIESQEGQQFINSGGLFAKLDDAQNQNNSAPAQASAPAPIAGAQKIQMLVNDFTYEQYLQAQWTDQMLVDNGKAKWIQQQPAPAPSAPTPAPAPAGPPQPSAPVQQQATIQQPQQQMPSAAPVQQAPQAQNTATQQQTPAANWMNDEDDDMSF